MCSSDLQAFDVPGFPNRGREIVGDDAVLFALPDAGHEEDTGPDAGAAQGATLRGVGDTEPGHAFGLKREGAFDGSVAVTIGLDHSTNGYARADVLLYGAEIFSERAERNLRPGSAVENQRAPIGYLRQVGARCIHLADYNERTALC